MPTMRRGTSKGHWMRCVVVGMNESDMTKDQRIIAEAAIARGQAATYEMIREEVSLKTGVPITEVGRRSTTWCVKRSSRNARPRRATLWKALNQKGKLHWRGTKRVECGDRKSVVKGK